MRTPAGFKVVHGQFEPTDWMRVIFNPSFVWRRPHMLAAVLISACFFIAGISAWYLVKGRAKGQGTITVTRNEIIYGLNQADKFILAIVLVGEDDSVEGPYYVRNPFSQEPDWAEASKNLDLNLLLARAASPAECL